MAEQGLRLDLTLGHQAGPVPADLAEGLATDGTPLPLHFDPLFVSLPHPPPVPGHGFDWELLLVSLKGVLLDAVPLLHWFFLLYFFVFFGSYLFLNLVSFFMLRLSLREQGAIVPPKAGVQNEIPISIILLAGNDSAKVIASVHAMLQLDYSEFEVIVVSDDPQGQVQAALAHAFSLIPFPEAYRECLPGMHVKGVLASSSYPGLRLVDKESRGRADALNAALNVARYPLYCNMGVDFILQRDSLRKMGQIFQREPDVVVACASVGTANGCTMQGGLAGSVNPPRTWLALFQVIEYLRRTRFVQICWSRFNALLITSRTFSMFRKDAVIAAGGYSSDAMNEDMELTMRIHRLLRPEGKPYRISHVPDPVCWAEAPGSREASKIQCINEQKELAQSLEMNRQLLFGRKSGAVGWVSFPFTLLFELFGPFLEILGYLVMMLLWLSGLISMQAFWTFLFAAIGLGVLLSTSALLLDELIRPGERNFAHTLKLFAAAILENLGHRQLRIFWRAFASVKALGRERRANGAGTMKAGLPSHKVAGF